MASFGHFVIFGQFREPRPLSTPQDPETQTKHISLVEAHSAEMDDAVLDVAYSPIQAALFQWSCGRPG